MKAKPSFLLTLAIAAGILTSFNAQAHGIWFAQRSDQLALIYGEGAEDADTIKRLPLVKGIAAYDASGATVETKLITSDHLLLVDMQRKPLVITGMLDNGLWTVGPDGEEVNKGKSQVPGAKSSGHYLKYAVHVLGDLKAPLAALKGQRLQLTPVSAALPKHMGDSITLRALYDGKPLAGASVIVDFVNDPEGKPLQTSQDGTITLKVRNQGLNVISIAHDAPTDNAAETDKVQHRATLSFALAAGGE